MVDVFVSHSAKDRASADAACLALEAEGFACWVAPRDVPPGADYATSIVDGIASARVQLLLLTESAVNSPGVAREIERAVTLGVSTLTIRFDGVSIPRGLEYFLGVSQWMEADSSTEVWLAALVAAVRDRLGGQAGASAPTLKKPTEWDTYRKNLRWEIQNNLVLELYDRPRFEDLCIQPVFRLVDRQVDSVGPGLAPEDPVTLDCLLGRSSQATITGEPGSGKTTALRLACLRLLDLDDDTRVPVYLSLSSISSSRAPMTTLDIARYVDDEITALGGASLADMAPPREPVLLLDGWDELPDDDARTLFRRYLISSRTNFIVASRKDSQRTLPSADRYEVAELSPDRMRELMSRRLAGKSALDRFMRWVRSDPLLTELASSPLSLSLMGIAFEESAEAVRVSRTEVYGRALDAILRMHHRHQSAAEEEVGVGDAGVRPSELEQVRAAVAYDVSLAARGRFFAIGLLEAVATRILGDRARGLTPVLVGRLGILRDRRGGRVEFFHLWYQEFLAAQFILGMSDTALGRKEMLNSPALAGSVPYAIGLLHDKRQARELLMAIDIHDVFSYCRAIRESQLSSRDVGILLGRLLCHGERVDPPVPVRLEMAPAICLIGDAAREPLLEILEDESKGDYARRAALESLAQLSDPELFSEILVRQLGTKQLGLLWHVLEQVGERRVGAAHTVLLMLTRHADPIVVGDAAWALSRLDGGSATISEAAHADLLRCLEADSDPHVRGHALRTLGRMRMATSLPSLHRYLKEPTNPYRWIVCEAVATIGGPAALSVLEDALSDDSATVVAAALEGLARMDESVAPGAWAHIAELIRDRVDDTDWIGPAQATLGEVARHVLMRMASRSETEVTR